MYEIAFETGQEIFRRDRRMAKKIRFPLEMENGVEVRSVEELRDNFSIVRVLGYVKDGKLITWLRDRYANDLADQVEQLDKEDPELPCKICKIIDVEYDENSESELEKDMERLERLNRLKTYTNEQKYRDVIDQVAFDQDELYDLLDENVVEIYLCGDRFSIPLAKHGIAYIGINNPMVVIDSKVEVKWNEKNITLDNVVFDEKYQTVLRSVCKEEEKEITVEKDLDKGMNTDKENAIELFREIVNKKKSNNTYMMSDHQFSLLGYNEDCLIYSERWKAMIGNMVHCNNYRYFRKEDKEELITTESNYVQCCVYNNLLFTIVKSSKEKLYVSNLDGTGKKKILVRDETYGILLRASIENDVIYVYYQKPSDKDEVWKSEWYNLKENHEWETLYDDSVGIFTI